MTGTDIDNEITKHCQEIGSERRRRPAMKTKRAITAHYRKRKVLIMAGVAVVCAVLAGPVLLALKTGVDNTEAVANGPVFPEIVVNDTVNEESIPDDVEVTVTELATEETKVENTEDTTVLGLKENTGKGYLNRCVFLGDSRTVALVNNALINDDQALAQIGISHPSFKSNTFINNAGKEYTLKSYLASHQSPVIYIALGVNGINDPSEEHYKSTFSDLVDTVIQQAPTSNVVLMSIGPVNDNGSYKKTVQNSQIEKYNAFLRDLAEEKHSFYLNVSEILTGSNGQVKPEYDAGDGLHYSGSGCQAILDYIVEHPVPGIDDDGEYVVHYIKPNPRNIKVTMDEGSGIDESVLEELMNMMVESMSVTPTDTTDTGASAETTQNTVQEPVQQELAPVQEEIYEPAPEENSNDYEPPQEEYHESEPEPEEEEEDEEEEEE